jgi:hypothetical protein
VGIYVSTFESPKAKSILKPTMINQHDIYVAKQLRLLKSVYGKDIKANTVCWDAVTKSILEGFSDFE